MGTIWGYRYESGIPKNQKVFDLVYVYSIGTFDGVNFLQISLIVSVQNLISKNYRYCKLITSRTPSDFLG